MRSPRPVWLLLACVISAALGCNRTATTEPFARQDPNVEIEGLAVVMAGTMGQIGMSISDTTARLVGTRPKSLQWARTLADPEARPDELREAMLGLVRYDYARKEPYTDAYAQRARSSPHALVRASALRALNISRDRNAVPLYIELLDDEDAKVRIEAAKALANIPDDSAAGPLLRAAQNPEENLDARLAAIDALRHYEGQESLLGLVGLLESEEFSVTWQARRSLITATGEDHGFDALAWRRALV